MDAPAKLAALARDSSSGASEITQRAREVLARWARDPTDPSAVRQAVLALVQAHPSMAPVVHLANEALQRLEEGPPGSLTELARDRSPVEQVAVEAADELVEADTVATYSRSGTVLAAIDAALDRGSLEIWTSEARPGDEGLDVARQLADAGADVGLTYDVALPDRVDDADLVLVGADAITPEGFVNKTGTRLLLERAQAARTPTRLLAARDKLWPTSLPREPSLDPQGRLDVALPESVRVHAPLFERVPLTLVDRVVTEDGAQSPAELARQAEQIGVHPDVVEAVASAR